MDKKKKAIICLIGIIIVLGAIMLFYYLKGNKIVSELENKIKSEKEQLVLIGKDNCIHCQRLQPKLNDFSNYYGFDYYYINMNDILFSKQKEELLSKINLTYEEFPGTPYLVTTKNKEVIKALIGNTSENTLYAFLLETNIIKEDKKPINYLNIDTYLSLINKNKNSLIYFGQENCDNCIIARSNLYALAKKYNLEINYLNLSTLDSKKTDGISEITKFEDSFKLLSSDVRIPLLLIVKDNKIIAETVNYEKEDYIDFLKENAYISES